MAESATDSGPNLPGRAPLCGGALGGTWRRCKSRLVTASCSLFVLVLAAVAVISAYAADVSRGRHQGIGSPPPQHEAAGPTGILFPAWTLRRAKRLRRNDPSRKIERFGGSKAMRSRPANAPWCLAVIAVALQVAAGARGP